LQIQQVLVALVEEIVTKYRRGVGLVLIFDTLIRVLE
jgi:hypothetical protein